MDDTGTTYHVEQPTPTEQEARAAQKVFNRYGHLPPGEHNRLVEESALQRLEIRELNPYTRYRHLYDSLDRTNLISFIAPNTGSEMLNRAREQLNNSDFVGRTGSDLIAIEARPGTAARQAQERRAVRMRNFLTNGVM
jgi:hypothetical protein